MDRIKKAFHRKRPRIPAAAVFLALLSLLTSLTGGASAEDVPAALAPSADSCILAESESGAVLYEKNADSRMLIASTTKMLTALVVLDRCDTREKVVIDDDFKPVEGSSMYIKPGETLTVGDLLYGLMLASGNDAAAALAIYVSGSIDAFAGLMNKRAAGLGCTGSHFVNPHGLDADGHYSTARDLWRIAREAMKNDTFREIVSTKYMSAAGRSLKNHNKLLWSCPGAVGIKTGYTESAGRSLVSSAERDGMRLVCVTLSDPDDWKDHANLYDWAFGHYQLARVPADDGGYGALPVVSGVAEEVPLRAAENYAAVYPKSDDIDIRAEAPRFVYAPVKKGARAGIVTVTVNGKTEKTVELVYGGTVALDKSVPLSGWEKLKRLLGPREPDAATE